MRHLTVAPDGVVYGNTWSGRYYGIDKPHSGGFLVALKDTTGSGKADDVKRFGSTVNDGGHGGTGIFYFKDYLYAEINDKIVKYQLTGSSTVPTGKPITVVSGLPLGGDHPMHPFAIDAEGSLFVDVATATNSCQAKNRTLHSPGITPCTELETRGGVWRYDAAKTDQVFSPAERYATGIRNAEGFGLDAAGHRIFVTQHGRDQLHTNWPETIKDPGQEATLPSEEMMLLKQGGDYGWPFCYYDPFASRLVLAPEYGGDGKTAGLWCAEDGSGGGVPGALGAERHAVLRSTAASAALSPGCVHRLSWVLESRALHAGRLQRRIPIVVGRQGERRLRDLCGRLFPGRIKLRQEPRIVPQGWPLDPMVLCTYPMTSPDVCIASRIEPAQTRRARRWRVPATPTPQASPRLQRHGLPRGRTPMRERPSFLPEQLQAWSPSAIAFITVKPAQPARVVTAQTVAARRSVLT